MSAYKGLYVLFVDVNQRILKKSFVQKIISEKVVTSTNDLARAYAQRQEPGIVIVAEQQTAGRGRLGRPWTSKPGTALTFSLTVQVLDKSSLYLPYMSGFAMHRAISDLIPELATKIGFKWPNDIRMTTNRRKLSGVLVEVARTDEPMLYAVVGVGVNVNEASREDFSPEIRELATSLLIEGGRVLDRQVLLGRYLVHFDKVLDAIDDPQGKKDLVDYLNQHNYLKDRPVRVQVSSEETVSGTVVGFHTDGALLVFTGSKTELIYSGDITELP